jgi:hypothetical protein
VCASVKKKVCIKGLEVWWYDSWTIHRSRPDCKRIRISSFQFVSFEKEASGVDSPDSA